MIRDFISLIFPINCINCKQSLISEEKYLCTSCKIDLPLTNDHQNESNDLFKKFAFEPKIRSAAAYMHFNVGGITQKLLHNFKYKGQKEIGMLLGSWMAPTLDHFTFDEIVPVPLHPRKLRKRGFNQSEVIAKQISDYYKVPVNTTLIEREVYTQSQTRKSKANRWSNMQNVFSKATTDCSGKSILVVDDVITTGATVGMLCERLVEASVDQVHLASIARGN
ncbi:ComF family protein [Ekhidna sp.]|uniref:ComF family protein n=1 Tax=Ekhidna sp. TaxID=2608089 RepID=UPI003CCB91C4